MLNQVRPSLTGMLCVAFAIMQTGCAGPGGRPSGGAPGPLASPAADVDLSKAYLSLSEVPPKVESPSTEGLRPPLSEKAARQVAKAQQKVAEQRYTEAAIDLERALRRNPSHPVIHRTLATLHWQAGNIERARTHANQSVKFYADDAMAHFILGRCAAVNGDAAGAFASYRTALLCSDIGENLEIAILTHHRLAEVLGLEGYLEAAIGEYEAFEESAMALDDPPSRGPLATLLRSTNGSAGEVKADLLERLGRLADAADAFAPVAAASEGDLETETRYARLLANAGRFDEALDAARRITSDDERTVIQLMFDIYQSAGRPTRIIDDLRARLANRPDDTQLVIVVSDMLAQLDRIDDAVAELQRYIATHADSFEVREKMLDLQIAGRQWVEALRAAAEAIRHHPRRTADIVARIEGVADHEDARAAIIEEVADLDDGDFGSTLLGGLVAAKANRLELARELFEKAHLADASSVEARVALARVYLRQYNYGNAIRIARRKDEEVPQDVALEIVLGDIYERLDKVDEAEGHYRAALQLDRDDPEAMLALAKLFSRSGRSLKAQRRLRVVLNAVPRHEEARELLASHYVHEGKADAAAQQLVELKRLVRNPLAVARADALLSQFRSPNPTAYREQLLEAVSVHGGDVQTWLAIADSYDRVTEADERYDAFFNALKIDPDSEEAAFQLAIVEQRRLEFEESAARLEALLPRRPNRHSWRRRLIETYWITREFDKALALARRQESREDLDEETRTGYRVRIVDSLRFSSRTDEALTLLESWVESSPNKEDWQARLANAYIFDDQPERALPILIDRYDRAPDDRSALQRLVEVLVTADQGDRAAQYALDWVHQDPDNDAAVALLITALQEDEHVDDAIELCRNALLRTFNRQCFQNLIIQRLLQAQRYKEGFSFIESLIDEVFHKIQPVDGGPGRAGLGVDGEDERIRQPNPNASIDELHNRLSELRLNLSRAYILAGDYREAEKMLTAWLEPARDPRWRVLFLRWLVQCYQGMGDERRAIETLERALLLQPDNVTFNNDLAYTLADTGVRLDEAEQMIRYALWRAPRQGAYLDTFGWVLYKKGEFEQALKWLERANDANVGGDSVLLDHLGDAYWRVGKKNDAIKYWEAAVENLKEADESRMIAADMRRVRDGTPAKIEAARSGQQPSVASVAADEAPLRDAGDS